jgi:DNA-binding NarL/FixJ family response regulator
VDVLAQSALVDVVLLGWLGSITDLVRHAAVIVLSDAPDGVAGAIEAGASGFLVHGGYEPSQLVDAVLAAAAGQPCASPAAMTALVQAIRRRPSLTGSAPTSGLSTRERDVMRLVADGLTNHEVGRRLGLTEKTVKNHLQNIYTRLGVQTEPPP